MTRPRFSSGHRDANELEITAVLDAAHIRYIRLREGDGADLLIETHPMYFVEVKNGDKSASRKKLTEAERRLMAHCEEKDIPYYVVETADEMLQIINWKNGGKA